MSEDDNDILSLSSVATGLVVAVVVAVAVVDVDDRRVEGKMPLSGFPPQRSQTFDITSTRYCRLSLGRTTRIKKTPNPLSAFIAVGKYQRYSYHCPLGGLI